ncbi:MAG: glutamine--fructose-6-phosphate transaminase (isomerizing) [Pelotomaculum sp.]|uniref:Glutamine--fructose-6-phosphate aminotransferase [isomerizing] n=1 Tax=Pelotomaculum thermopropionicum (strain DSM 13744 / JCM 10971 / SI) TaxID=370438 RepID=A5D4W8_PELTS|nr:glutamine--fructose-6-phosphate transaminase (isomerizing) [Pelotomaculum sp.]BAF58720.1 glucosamine 6-phosphate synthetase [Pelotomaculum thermopropionicum SI]
MCGIVGYIGPKEAVPVLFEGLSRLEYRGYDSAGVAFLEEGGLKVLKKEGKLSALGEKLNGCSFCARVGIGHTRWATHGRPSDENAHPHVDCGGRLAVVHNGIIENYLSLKEWLQAEGHVFRSQTDTEVLPHLIEHYYNGDLVGAVLKAVSRLEGSFAIAVISSREPDRIVAVRQDSPLVVGLGEGENFLASDIPALLKHTRRVYILDDGEVAVLEPDRVRVMDRSGREVGKEARLVNWKADQAEKGGYDHFMLKEIYEQPKALRDTLSGRISADGTRVVLDEVSLTPEEIRTLKRIYITACGTAYHAGLVGKYILERLVRLPVEVDIASEFRYRHPIIEPGTLVMVISQSGETADTLAALREARRQGARVIAVTNVVGSSVSREADDVIYTWAGPEIAVASTKAYTTQLVAMYLFALYLAAERKTAEPGQIRELLLGLKKLADKAQSILDNTVEIKDFAGEFATCKDLFFIGRGLDYAVALEGSLKLKEISYIHAEAYAAGELKHGTLALIEEKVPVVALATQVSLFDKMIGNIQEVNARGASVLALAMQGLKEVEKVAGKVVYIPETNPVLAPVLTVIPLQLLAYHTAVARGCDVDKPRNLAKSVTVE